MRNLFTAAAIILMGSTFLYAADRAGTITKYQGVVRVYKKEAVRGEKVREENHEIFVGDLIKTKRNALAFVSLADSSRTVLKENSTMEIEGMANLNVKEGRVLFRIKKQGTMRGLKVKSKSVIIGVKGTEFLVDSPAEDLKIYLKEGHLTIESPEGEFKRFIKREKEEFEEYKQKKIEEFEEFKKELEEEFIEYVREFELESGTAVVIKGNEVRDIALSPAILEEFRLFDRNEIN